MGLPSENENKKRQRLQEMNDYEEGKKVLSPSIFRKNKGPIILAASMAAISSNNSLEAPNRTLSAAGFKKPESLAAAKEITLQDYDISSCLDIKDVHCK